MNRVIHFEIHAKNMDALQRFYTDVFDWDMQNMGEEMGNYRVIRTGPAMPDTKAPGINGGMTPRQGDIPMGNEAVNAYVCIVGVDDVDAQVEKIKDAGGSIALDPMEVPDVGKLAYCKDPEGNLFGILKPSISMSEDTTA